jgi:uncharacterized membrane protein
MNDLLIAIVGAVEIIFYGSETILDFLSNTTILGATLYGWFLAYLVFDTIISIFIDAKTDKLDETVSDTVSDTVFDTDELNYELD